MPSMVVQVIPTLFFNAPKLPCLWILNLCCLYCLWIFTPHCSWSPPVTLTSYRQSSTLMGGTTSSLEPMISPESCAQRKVSARIHLFPNLWIPAGGRNEPLQDWSGPKSRKKAGNLTILEKKPFQMCWFIFRPMRPEFSYQVSQSSMWLEIPVSRQTPRARLRLLLITSIWWKKMIYFVLITPMMTL